MSALPPLRRLIDLPGVIELERAAVLTPLPEIGETRQADAEADACAMALFGLTPEEADLVETPDDFPAIDHKPIAKQVLAFEDAGWDVTDAKRRPLRVLAYLGLPLWLAIQGVAGELPYLAPEESGEEAESEAWGADLEAEASRFRKR